MRAHNPSSFRPKVSRWSVLKAQPRWISKFWTSGERKHAKSHTSKDGEQRSHSDRLVPTDNAPISSSLAQTLLEREGARNSQSGSSKEKILETPGPVAPSPLDSHAPFKYEVPTAGSIKDLSRQASHLSSHNPPAVQPDLGNIRPLFQQLAKERDSISGFRIRVRQRRKALCNTRIELMETDARFTQDLRALAVKSTDPGIQSLLEKYEESQSSRDVMQIEENVYNDLEDDLIQHEWQMDELESKLYARLRKVEGLQEDDLGSNLATENDNTTSAGSTASPKPSLSPWARQLYSTIGDRNILLEQVVDLEEEQARFLQIEQTRAIVNLEVDEEARQFLDNYESRHVALQEDIAAAEDDIVRLQYLISQGDNTLYSSHQFDHPDSTERPDDSSLQAFTEHDPDLGTQDPLLIQEEGLDMTLQIINASPKSFQSPSKKISPSEKQGKVTANFAASNFKVAERPTSAVINEWLLNNLRRSPFEIRRFKTTEKLRTLALDRQQLKLLVLHWWSRDETVAKFSIPKISTVGIRSDLSMAKSVAGSSLLPRYAHPHGKSQANDVRDPSGLRVRREYRSASSV